MFGYEISVHPAISTCVLKIATLVFIKLNPSSLCDIQGREPSDKLKLNPDK